MEIEFDRAKDEANTAKHGISLSAASEFEMGGAMVSADERANYARTGSLPSASWEAVSMS